MRVIACAVFATACGFSGSTSRSDAAVQSDAPADADVGIDAPAAYASCAAALTAGVKTDGVLTIDPGDGMPAFRAFCDQTGDGGGWTLALKADGDRDTFRFESPLWTDFTPLSSDMPDRDLVEAKLASYWRMPVAEVRVVLPGGSAVLAMPGANLRVLFAGPANQPNPSPIAREKWLALVPGATADMHCPFDGINVGASYNRVRIGLLTNNELPNDEDCDPFDGDAPSWDAKLGIGGSYACAGCDSCPAIPGDMSGPSVGSNHAGCGTVTGFGYIYIR